MEKIKYRKKNHFQEGEVVIIYIKKDSFFLANKPEKSFFLKGLVKKSKASMVIVEAERAITNNFLFLKGRGLAVGEARPEIMKKREFEYLLKFPEAAQEWAEEVGFFDIEEFIRALKREAREKNIKI